MVVEKHVKKKKKISSRPGHEEKVGFLQVKDIPGRYSTNKGS